MKKNVLVAMAAGVALFGSAAAGNAGPKKELVDSLRAGKGVLEKKCKLCHSLRLPLAKLYDREEWTISVKRMVTYGAPLNAAERGDVIAYLSGRSSFARNCGSCHEAARVVPDDDGARDWTSLLKRMAGHLADLETKGMAKGGIRLTEEGQEEIAAFLTVILGGK